ncbi:MAG: hypothetical protein ABI325_00605 [Ginsengibacter sp.]
MNKLDFSENKCFVMDSSSVQPPLSNVQSEMLKLFSTDIPEKELVKIKDLIARYLLDKARDKADAAWDYKGYSDQKRHQILVEKDAFF